MIADERSRQPNFCEENIHMTTEHTPGPWQYTAKLSASENHRGFHILDTDGWALGFVQPGDEDGNLGGANARLMAAAPELAGALRLLTDAVHLGVPGAINEAWTAARDLLKELDR